MDRFCSDKILSIFTRTSCRNKPTRTLETLFLYIGNFYFSSNLHTTNEKGIQINTKETHIIQNSLC